MQLHIVVSLERGYSKVLQVSDSAPCYDVTSFAKLKSVNLHREDVVCCILEFSLSKWQNWGVSSESCSHIHKSSLLATGTDGPLGKKMNNDVTRSLVDWQPKYNSFAAFLGIWDLSSRWDLSWSESLSLLLQLKNLNKFTQRMFIHTHTKHDCSWTVKQIENSLSTSCTWWEPCLVMVCMGHTLFSVACNKTVESIDKKDHRNSLRKQKSLISFQT